MSNLQEFFITPIEDYFARPFPEAQKTEITKRLSRLKTNEMIALYDAGIEQWKRLPILAEIMETNKKLQVGPEYSSPRSDKSRLTDAEVAKVMEGTIGTEAFENDWWWELYQHLTYRAKSTYVDFDMVAALKSESLKRYSDETMEAKISQIPSGPMRESFQKIWDRMRSQRAEVYQNYAPENRFHKAAN